MLSWRTTRNLLAFCAFSAAVVAQTRYKNSTTTGILRQLTPQQWILEAEDHRVLWYQIPARLPLVDSNGKRIDLPSLNPPIDLGDRITVLATEDGQGHLLAQTLMRVAAGTPQDKVRAAATWDLPDAPPDAIPNFDRAQRQDQDPVIQKARHAALEFSDLLPNFTVQQVTERYSQADRRRDWSKLDTITADLVDSQGEEIFSNIRVDNHPSTKTMDQVGGLRTNGEFSSLADNVLAPEIETSFYPIGQEDIYGREAWRYRFEVAREKSVWRLRDTSQLYYSAYTGTLWIDKETYRILRLEQETRDLPTLFPFDRVEFTVSYGIVRLGEAGSYLLPVEAEALDCERGSSICMKNHTEYRNYRKFTADSTIVFEK